MQTRKRLRRIASATSAAILLGFSSSLAVAAPASHVSGIGIDNFGRVNAAYYRGGQPQGSDYSDLARLGVKTVVNLTSDDAEQNEPALVKSAGMAYYQIPMTTHTAPTPAQVSQFLKILNDPANQPVYVHCVGGRHRTGVMTAVYRMTHEGWTAEQAFNEMKQYKFGADFLHSEFKSFVYGYPTLLARTNPSMTTVATGDRAAVK